MSNMILVKADFKTLKLPWIMNFIDNHSKDIIYLPKGLLILYNDAMEDKKATFLRRLSYRYSDMNSLPKSFFARSIQKYKNKSIKFELTPMLRPRNVFLDLVCRNSQVVIIELSRPNKWVMSYLASQLGRYIADIDDQRIMLNLYDMQAKARFEHALDKESVLHYQLTYQYDEEFMQKLYSDFTQYTFNKENPKQKEDAKIVYDENQHYYTVLECEVGATSAQIRQNYKKLIKIYHPDRVYSENSELVNEYTQKFQQLQEAYTALNVI